MKIVFYEMKKICNRRLLFIVALICALFFSIFMEFDITVFPNGHPETETVDFTTEMTQRYGATLEEDEFADFMKNREGLIAEAETYIKNNPIFAAAGIYSYADYETISQKEEQTKAETDARWALLGEECDFVRFKLETLDRIEEFYSLYPTYHAHRIAESTDQKELARLTEIQQTEEYRNIMDGTVFSNTVSYSIRLAILSVLSVLVLVSPLIVTDRSRNVHLLQYTAKYGRKIMKAQFIAVLFSAFLLTTILIVGFGAIYSTNGTWVFWDNGLTSFLNDIFWLDLTYGQYIIAYLVMLYALCLGAAAVAFALSRFSQNAVTLVLKLIPVFAVLAGIGTCVFNYTFGKNILYGWTGVVGIEPLVCGIVLTAGLAAALYTVQREQKVDVNV